MLRRGALGQRVRPRLRLLRILPVLERRRFRGLDPTRAPLTTAIALSGAAAAPAACLVLRRGLDVRAQHFQVDGTAKPVTLAEHPQARHSLSVRHLSLALARRFIELAFFADQFGWRHTRPARRSVKQTRLSQCTRRRSSLTLKAP